MRLRIRPIRADEGLRLRALRLEALAAAPEAFASTFAREAAFADQVWHDRAAAGAKGSSQTTLIAEEGGGWVGLATGLAAGVADNPRPMLVGMFVAVEARGRGVGAALVEGVIDWVRLQGAHGLVLWVRDNNAAAAALYRKCGFRPTGMRRAVAPGPALAEIEMLRELDAAAP
jgi:GNAT superfamily N-acetyltransferase